MMRFPKRSRLSLLAALVAVLAASACRTTGESTPLGVVQQAPVFRPAPPSQPAPALTRECPAPHVGCTQDFDPVLCSAAAYNGRSLPEDSRLYVWGQNTCDGRSKLTQAACDRQLAPSRLGQVQCVPDTSGGHCPPQPLPCSAGGKPMVCTAATYADQPLVGPEALRATGLNECAATAALSLSACRRNLDPLLLRGVSCKLDPTAGECPPREGSCAGSLPRGATCTARRLGGQDLAEPLTAKAPTACEAKHLLARQACERQQRPSTLDLVTCTFEK